jgi:uncharacterized membrane protein
MESLFFTILIPLFFVGSILAFVSLSSARRIESKLKSFPLNDLTSRVYQLEQKLAEVQKAISSSAPITPAPSLAEQSSVSEAAPQQSAPLPTPRPASMPQSLSQPISSLPKIAREPSPTDLEDLIGGRWFNRIGIIALLFAVSYFLKLAFDNNWIGPPGRVAIGMLLGLLMLPWSEWLLTRDYTYFSEGIAGLGEATLFVSVWSGCQYYTLFSRHLGFFALVLVTAIMAFLALRRNSQRIAFLSLLGGLLTPALMSSGKNQQVILFSYLLLLGTAALLISWRRTWQSLLPLAFGGTHLYFWQWYDQFYSSPQFLGGTLFFATLFFLLYAVIPAVRALFRHPLRVFDFLLVLANPFAFIAILFTLLWPNDRWPLTLFFLALAIAHEALALLLPGPNSEQAAGPRLLYTGVAVSCFTLAIPSKLEHNAITLALSAEGAALVWTGFRFLGNLLRPFGYFLLILSALHLFAQPPAAGTFLFNERFETYVILIASLAVCLWSALAISRTNSEASPGEGAVLTVAINFFALVALSQELWDFFGSGSRALDHSLPQHLSISIFWTVYAGLLLLLGIQRQSPLLRWQALILLGIVVFKVFFYDLSFLDRAYRILSFFILGSALLAVSFFYQRKLARNRAGS